MPTAEIVLLVNDIPDHVAAYGAALAAHGFEVRIARTGDHALRIVRDALPTCAVIDLRLPDMNGWELCRAIKTSGGKGTPIVVLTPEVSKVCAADSEKSGCNAWIARPTVAEDLVRTVKHVLSHEAAEPRTHDEAMLGVLECAACGSHDLRATLRMSPIQYYCCKTCGFCWRVEVLQRVS